MRGIPALKIFLSQRGNTEDLSASSAFVMPDIRHRASIFASFQMDLRYQPGG
ncbi:MAG: hypothetical protein OEY80_09220 [Nitrospirota bacterium]|nr:hypothetical protein [Nitrospirota bacterium]MDH4360783.1 hypothetical protein [Nitrospirota bacterium]MDH5575650.1 hypothetical protein [Nitrospirota bacterium]